MGEQVRAQVHRFRNCVAVYVGTGETVYMTPKDARKLSRAINKAARSVEREKFVDSSGNTCEIDAPDGRDVAFVRKLRRERTVALLKPDEYLAGIQKRAMVPGHPSACGCNRCITARQLHKDIERSKHNRALRGAS